jgi:hypothetical protein
MRRRFSRFALAITAVAVVAIAGGVIAVRRQPSSLGPR